MRFGWFIDKINRDKCNNALYTVNKEMEGFYTIRPVALIKNGSDG